MNNVKLTFIVPTRNRPDTLEYTLKTILAQENQDIEIIVSDNFSELDVKSVFDKFSDNRLRYIRTEKSLGMSEHWDFALEHVKGQWVSIIGDDDGLAPNAVNKFYKVLQDNPSIRAITCANSWFRWPSNENPVSKLSIIGSKGYEIRDCKEYMKLALSGKGVSQPTIYTGGFVRMDLINEIKLKSPDGKFFQSITPDYYSSMAICSAEDKYIYCYETWCIAGTSRHSNGLQHKHKSLEERRKLSFHQENTIKFYETLGDAATASVGSMNIYLYEAFLKAEHLRSDNLGITLPQQLEVSILCAGKRIKKELIEYSKWVANKNNIDFSIIEKNVRLKKPIYRLKKLTKKSLRSIGASKLPQKIILQPDLKNIYDASVKMGEILK